MSRITIISIFIIVLSILGGIFVWFPNFQELFDLKKDLKKIETEIKQKEEYFTKLKDISNDLEKYSNELDKTNSALPTDPSTPALFYFIKKAVSENGLAIESLSLQSTAGFKERSAIDEISFRLSISGTYPAFRNFLSTIYKNSRIIEVNNITFSSPKKGESDMFDFQLNLTTFSYLDEKGKEKKIR